MRDILPIFGFVGAIGAVAVFLYEGPAEAQMSVSDCKPNPHKRFSASCRTRHVEMQSFEECIKIRDEYNETHPEVVEGAPLTKVTSAQCSRLGFKASDVSKTADDNDEAPAEMQAYCLVEERDEAGEVVNQEYVPCTAE